MDRIQCPNCGQQYDARYQSCPFCGYRYGSAAKQSSSRKGGKRLAGKSQPAAAPRTAAPSQAPHRSEDTEPQYNAPKKRNPFWSRFFFLCSIILIIAAIFIVVSIVKTLFGDKGTPNVPETSGTVEVSPSAVPGGLAGITISPSELHLEAVGDTTRLSVFPDPSTASVDDSTITWTSGDESIVTVSESGLVTAVAKGTATVTAAYADLTAECQITVGPLPSSSAAPSDSPDNSATPSDSGTLKLNKEDFTLFSAGETYQLKVAGAQGDITWSVKNKSVATVSSSGVVTAVGQGKTTVTATVDGETLECIVRVK